MESCKDSYSISGKIIDILPQGNIIRYTVDINSVSLKVDVLFNDLELYALGQEVYLKLKKKSLYWSIIIE